jgi:adenylate kinase family enzyme
MKLFYLSRAFGRDLTLYTIKVTKILISGIPGTGKTTVAEYMRRQLGFQHVDMEADSFRLRRELERDPDAFLENLFRADRLVVSWGFSPYTDRPGVDTLIAAGYKFVWLDGDHTVALRNFLNRENHDKRQEANYYGQMQMILSTELVDRMQPICIDPFQGDGFRPLEEIAAEIIERTSV